MYKKNTAGALPSGLLTGSAIWYDCGCIYIDFTAVEARAKRKLIGESNCGNSYRYDCGSAE